MKISLKEMAKRLNLSTAAVSKALNDYPDISLATKKLVKSYAKKVGYKVIRVALDEDGNVISSSDFISGWLQNEKDWGRPVSPFIMRDGSMLISDDKHDVIYKIQYKG